MKWGEGSFLWGRGLGNGKPSESVMMILIMIAMCGRARPRVGGGNEEGNEM